ncbi:MAG TPA: MFS transporter [Gaiellaceae bacterium]|nr:MFS transporter [Gaiellaceae bacterium]
MPHTDTHTDTHTDPAPKRLLPLLLVAQLMVILDITAVNIAMPSLARDLHISGATISWTITAYSLVFGSLLLLGGRAADLLGRRRLFLTGLGIFTASSFASAMAGSAAALFAARAGQGLGAAMLSPAALSIITSTYHGPARAKALGAWGAVGGAGAALGVLIGGVLTEIGDWRLIFFVNLPVAAALALGARRIVPADTERPRWRGLDVRGAVLATAGMAALVYAITQADTAGWLSARTLAIGGLGAAALAAFAVCELRTAQPLLRIERLRDRAVGGGLLLCLVNAGLMFGLFLLCSLYLQLALGHGALPTGLAFIPLAVAAGIGASVAGHLINRHGLRWAAGPALVLAGGGLLLLAQVPADGSYLRDLLPGMLMAGFGLGLSGTAMAVGVLTGARHDEAGMISGASATGHELGGTFGIAIYASVATAAAGGSFVGPAAAAGIAHAFLIAAHVAFGAGVAAAVLLPAAKTFLPKLRLNPQAIAAH